MKIGFLISDLIFIIYFSIIYFTKEKNEYSAVIPFAILTLSYFMYKKYIINKKTKNMKRIGHSKMFELFSILIYSFMVFVAYMSFVNENINYNFTFLYLILSFYILETEIYYDDEKILFKEATIYFEQIENVIINKNNLEIKLRYKNVLTKLNFLSKSILKKTYNIIKNNIK